MKYYIDEDVLKKYHLSINDLLGIMLFKNGCDPQQFIDSLLKRDFIVKDMFGDYKVTQAYDDIMQKILLESEESIPKDPDLNYLVGEVRSLFPKGLKTGSAAWRGNKREITLRFQKFFKLYENRYSDEEIIEATKKYIDSFNGNYTYMRILKYFILKDEIKIREDGTRYVEQVSELANFLENDTNTVNSFDEMRYD